MIIIQNNIQTSKTKGLRVREAFEFGLFIWILFCRLNMLHRNVAIYGWQCINDLLCLIFANSPEMITINCKCNSKIHFEGSSD